MNDLFHQLDEIVGNVVGTTMSNFQAQDWIFIVVGILLLLFGRRLYWLALAGLGFAVAVHLSREFLLFKSGQQQVIVGIVLGLLGGLLAIVAQRLALRIAGLILGGWGAFFVARMVWPGDDLLLPLLMAAVGAILGVLFATKLFDLALVLASASIGAVLIAQHLYLDGTVQAIVWLVLALFGVAIQLGRRSGRRRRTRDDD